ncbi:MAG: ribosome recycling factor [Patescibacteria group bacterium]
MIDIHKQKSEFEKHLTYLQDELKNLRTGRASTSLVEGLMVEAYGTLSQLQHLASLSIPDARTILISPWDKSVLKDIEKGLLAANLGVNPVNDGSSIRLVMPLLTEENRKALVKVVGQKVEQAKIAVRAVRDALREDVQKSEKLNEITEDDRYDLYKQIDELTKLTTTRADEFGSKKEEDILTL